VVAHHRRLTTVLTTRAFGVRRSLRPTFWSPYRVRSLSAGGGHGLGSEGQSRLGANLQLRVEALVPYAETAKGRRLLSMPAHVATKVAALLDRPDSLPGRKDRQELHALLALPGARGSAAVVMAASQRTPAQVAALIGQAGRQPPLALAGASTSRSSRTISDRCTKPGAGAGRTPVSGPVCGTAAGTHWSGGHPANS
jgi:hypothetical protein